MPLTALSEMVAVAAIVPLIAVLTDVSGTARAPWLSAFLDNDSVDAFLTKDRLVQSGGVRLCNGIFEPIGDKLAHCGAQQDVLGCDSRRRRVS